MADEGDPLLRIDSSPSPPHTRSSPRGEQETGNQHESDTGTGVGPPPPYGTFDLSASPPPFLRQLGDPCDMFTRTTETQPTLSVASFNTEDDGDFVTVDWTYDAAQDRRRRIDLGRRTGIGGVILNGVDAMQGWIVLFLVGAATGVIAALIDLGAEWMFDLKHGYCRGNFWFPRHLCCQDYTTNECELWVEWRKAFGLGSPGLGDTFTNGVFCVIGGTIMAIIATLLVGWFAPYAAGSGIPETKTILGGVVIKRFLGGWTLLIKSLGLVFAVGSGLSLGKEGPFVHVACCIANIFARYFPKYSQNEGKKRELLSAASAAGVSVAFGAPIGGVLFSLEEVSSYFPHKTMWRTFFCAIIAALFLQFLDPSHTGKLVMFTVEYSRPWHWFELLPFALLGCCGGLVGAFFIRMNVKMCRLRKRSSLGRHPTWETGIVAFITCAVGVSSVFLAVSNTELLSLLFENCDRILPGDYNKFELCEFGHTGHLMVGLLLAVLMKLMLTIFTFGMRLPAGLFVPSLAVGACIGRITGTGMHLLHDTYPGSFFFAECLNAIYCVSPGIYGVVGAAAVLGGVTRMTVSLVVIMFELTGGLTLILPIMVTVIFSKWVGDAFGRESIYEEHIVLNGYPFLNNKGEHMFAATARDVMASDLHVITLHGNTIESLGTLVNSTVFQGFPVVTSRHEMLLVGYITRAELQKGLSNAQQTAEFFPSTPCFFTDIPQPRPTALVSLAGVLDRSPVQIVETTPLNRIIDMFRQLGLRYCLVTRHGKIVGIVTKKRILTAMDMFRPGRGRREETDDEW